jgi:hypothetical protein
MRELGQDLSREIASGDRADAQIDAFITRRDAKRRESEGDWTSEAAWREAERRLETRRRVENRAGWYDGWRHMARTELHGRLSREHVAITEEMLGEGPA